MSVHIKICGINELSAAQVATKAGVDSLGFVLSPSPRQVTPEEAASLMTSLSSEPTAVAVFRSPSPAEVQQTLSVFHANEVQADHESVGHPMPHPRLLPVFREGRHSVEQVMRAAAGTRFVYEGPRSGVGQIVDWEVAARLARVGQMTLAGGLHPDNVGEAVRTVRPFGVDVSSGVESRPGAKDLGRIREFVEAVREAETAVVRS